jgi:hypothetical protein
MNNVAISNGVQVTWLKPDLNYFGYIPGREIALSHGCSFSIFWNFFFTYSYVHTIFVPFLTPPPHVLPFTHAPTLSLPTYHFQAERVLPLSLIFLKRRYKHKKEDKEFLLVELRIAIQRDSYSSMCVCFTF